MRLENPFHYVRSWMTDRISDFVISQLSMSKISYDKEENGIFIRIERDHPKNPRVLDDLVFSLKPIMPKSMAVSISCKFDEYIDYHVIFGTRGR